MSTRPGSKSNTIPNCATRLPFSLTRTATSPTKSGGCDCPHCGGSSEIAETRRSPLFLALAGCGVLDPDGEGDLRDHRRRWVRQGISDYSYDFLRACFCGGPVRNLRVLVRNNVVVSVTDVETGAPPTFLPDHWVGTIDDVFAELQSEFDRNADEIELDFDDSFHFPVRARIDRVRNAIDDELHLELSNFQPLR